MRIVFYKKSNDKKPVKEFIDKLQKQEVSKIFKCLKDIEKNNLKSNKVSFRQIKGKLWEIKIKTIGGGYRIFYIIVLESFMVLLHIYKKQSQKAPRKELEKAIKIMKEVLSDLDSFINEY